MRNNRVILGVEGLEDRTMPSVVNPISIDLPAHLAATETFHFNQISGGGGGSYSVDRSNPNAGTIVHFLGSAHLGAAGHFMVTGAIQQVGNIATGHASGQLTFRDANGSFTILVTGGTQHGISPLPGKFQYHVLHGTGQYAHLPVSGVIDIARTPEPGGAGGTYRMNFEIH